MKQGNWKVDTWPTPPKHGMLTGKIYPGVKVTHLPTGLVEICDSERSQHANRDKALQILATRMVTMDAT